MTRTFVAVTCAALVPIAAVTAQNNWGQVGQDAGATKYSTLKQITTENVPNLKRAWTFHTGDASGFFESTPLAIDGILYFNAQNGFYAVDGVTGQQIWKKDANATTRRGLAYWPGDARTPGRLIGSTGTRLIALDLKTGFPVQGFGEDGTVEMGTQMASPPTIYKDLIITPGTTPLIRAWNARTGVLVWTFNLIAQPGQPGHETWENDAWKTIGGTNVWGYLTVDTERGIVYIPNSIAGSDYVGVERPGNNAYGTSLVAVDAATGKLKWYQQLVHHDTWDYDLAAHPTLFEATINGRRIPAVAQIGKFGLLFMFDRVTGRPLFGMEERPVKQGTVPGEQTSPTQPFPLKPEPLARISMKKDDLPTNITPELTAYCQGLWDKYKLQDGGPYNPWQLNQDIVQFPGAVGGGNWQGVSYNPGLNLLITNVMNAGQWGHLEEVQPGQAGRGGRGRGRGPGGPGGPGGPVGPGAGPGGPGAGAAPQAAPAPVPDAPARGARAGGAAVENETAAPARAGGPNYRKVTPEGGRFWQASTKYSCNAPPWGELIAVNTNTGDIAWRVPLGKFDELEAKGIKTGTPSLGGGITTAGNLVFIAATIDGYFRAFDARNGRELWSDKLEVPAHSIPSTYLGKNGKQYVVLPVGGGGFLQSPRSDVVAAYALP